MLIDWVTVVAQIINFLILVYLLKRFLYGPIVQAMNEREERIREEIEQADRGPGRGRGAGRSTGTGEGGA
jgi:F-type H+-transporting ATPase subunit b